MAEATDMGPMIDEREALRVQSWVDEAIQHGATVLTGHLRERAVYYPTVLENVSASATVRCEEAFGPVAILEPIESLEQGIRQANASEFSIHAAIFTRDLDKALLATEQLEAGGVMVNDSTDYRIDAMPFGGYKRGGLGREGVRFAIEEMTQPKVICFNMRATCEPAVSEE